MEKLVKVQKNGVIKEIKLKDLKQYIALGWVEIKPTMTINKLV